jgi:hypothetical protein
MSYDGMIECGNCGTTYDVENEERCPNCRKNVWDVLIDFMGEEAVAEMIPKKKRKKENKEAT